MIDRLSDWASLLREGPLARALIVLVSLMIGYVVGKMAGRAVGRALAKKLAPHQAMIARRLTFYLLMSLCVLTGFNEAGINLSVLVGAAGVLSVAVGFASQTTMSNLISGVFMLLERPFMIGDVIKIGGTTGEVTMVGLLSTTLKTPDNQMVRIPNESLMKSEITNTTRFQVRRVDIAVGIAYKSDLASARDIISAAIRKVPGVRATPEPQVLFKSFGDSSVNLSADFWTDKDDMGRMTLLVAGAIKDALTENRIEMPFPHRTLTLPAGDLLRMESGNNS
jgi:small-conductance mechanosensitive channel